MKYVRLGLWFIAGIPLGTLGFALVWPLLHPELMPYPAPTPIPENVAQLTNR